MNQAQRGLCDMTESQIFSHLAQPNLVSILSNDQFGDKLLKILPCDAVGFCSRAIRLFLAPLAQMSMALIINGFTKERLAVPHGSYDNLIYL